MQILDTKLPGVKRLIPRVFPDGRGYFLETFRDEWLDDIGLNGRFVQDNQSHSAKGVLRGLHLQLPPKGQSKLVRVVRGKIYDVAVDVQPSSPTYKQWVAVELSDDNHEMLFIPAHYAHGFVVLSDEADIAYKCSDTYSKDHERSIRYDDPELNITWPDLGPFSLSEKDQQGLSLSDFVS